MKGKRLGRTVAGCTAATSLLFGYAGVASASTASPADTGATIVNGTATFDTTDENKDHDTTLTIKVLTASGRTAATAVGDFGEFTDGSEHPIPLLVRPTVTWDQLQGGRLTFHVDPVGDDTWRFRYNVLLNFNDGDFSLTQDSNVISLSEDHKDYSHALEF
ncbi:hypothetical protein [Streptomyces sp. NPDC096013]|uniref:hypothetical protein n=1 Tax=Streptomyces sp. NPDC096013 TaxID=3366069 RepID=UPI0038189271